MREILFRGKRVDNGEWVQGDLLHPDLYGNGCSIEDFTKGKNNCCDVLPETIGQFTGLTDKNGTKIFEGDIVRYGDTVHEVVFEQRNGTAYFGLVYSEIETLPFGHYQDLKQIEIIGNVRDNPELLEVGNE